MTKEFSNKECIESLDKVKVHLMLKPSVVFFSTLCFSLVHSFDRKRPTAATDGINIWYNNEFFMSLTIDEKLFLVLHEVMHCAYLHISRKGDRCIKKWRIATDHVINLQLIERGFKMPKCGLANPAYTGMSADEIYLLLPEVPPDQEDPLFDFLEPLEDLPDDALIESITNLLIGAEMASKSAQDEPGTIPQALQIFLDGLVTPKLPYTTILRRYLNNICKNDYTFKKLNRRYFPTHYLPSLHSEAMIDLVIAVDTSGSVTTEEFTQFITDIHSIFKSIKPEKITLIQFDTEIKSIDVLKKVSDIYDLSFTGRGGTEITDVIDWINKNKPKITLIYTDGEFKFRKTNTKHDLIWLIHNNPAFNAKYGKVIHYTI